MPEGDPIPEPENEPAAKPAPRLGSYLLVQSLGSGGMSNVFRAVHEETGSVVALKVLPRTLAKNPTLLQRFMREAKSAEALDHPNVVAIYDRGFDQGRHYLVLEYVEGRDLHDRVRLNGPLGAAESVGFVREVAGGLRYAAGKGMIHRDVKPANLLMTPDGHAKIIDLGLALQIEDEDERVTRDGTTVGTVDYMAPEQARDSRQTSERSDIYSLGCTFYYLLTGSPPFPGGGLSDKLAHHYKGPIPDVRATRPEIPERLSALIRKMMAKKPEGRFADYTRLIEALDALDDPPTQELGEASMDALIVDDDDDDETGPASTEAALPRTGDGRPPSAPAPILMAEIVDDDDDAPVPTLPPPGPRPRSGDRPPRREPVSTTRAASPPGELSLADLVALDADEPPARSSGRRPSAGSGAAQAGSNPAQPAGRPPAMPIAEILEEDGEEVFGVTGPPRRGAEVPLKTWIAAGVMVGLTIAIVGFGASMIVSMNRKEPPAELERREVEVVAGPAAPETTVTPTYRPRGPIVPIKKAAPVVVVAPPTTSVAPVALVPPPEKTYPADWEAKFGIPAAPKAPAAPERSVVVVRRATLAGNEPQTSSLAGALSRAGDVVEIADAGPFFEDDCQVAGNSRVVRARGGVRPMIKVELAGTDTIRDQAAKFVLGGSKVESLVLEGIDLAVDVRDLPDHQSTLFLCQGADLTLRDCSLTIFNANDASRAGRFSIFRLEEGAKPNRIVLERSTIRGPIGTLIDVASGRAEVTLDRSLILGDASPLIVLGPSEKGSRSIHFRRSLLATRGHVLELSGKSIPPMVRSLGTLYARFEPASASAPQSPGLVNVRGASAGDPPSSLDWAGEDDEFLGWPGWLTAGPEGSARVGDLAGLRAAYPGSDATSRESPTPWTASPRPDELVPAEFAPLAPALAGTLAKIASPHPRLKELTIGSLARLSAPELSATLISPPLPPPLPAANPNPTPKAAPAPVPQPNATGPRPKPGSPAAKAALGPPNGPIAPPPPPPGPLHLTFNVQDAPWRGDLGLFLTEKVAPGTPQATVLVRGSGVHATSPVRLPDGLSIAILGEATEGLKLPMPTFVPKPAAAGRALFELHGGDLAIAHLGFSSEGATRPRHWVLVEDGLLGLRHCRFRDPAPGGPANANVGSAIAFVARGSTPIPPRVGPLEQATDRPTARLKNCLIWTAAEAISAEVGRGVVDLENCLVISGGPAFALLPSDVPRDRFAADLVLDRCTVAVDHTAVLLGPLAGSPTGPARPWLVSTRRCAFPRTQVAGQGGALLQVDPDAMARGTLLWQSSADIYDVPHFLAATGPQLANFPSADLKKQWTDLWGQEHTKLDQGPNPRRNESVLRYKDKEKPKPGKVVPASLELDKAFKDVGVDFKDLPGAPRADPAARPNGPGRVGGMAPVDL